MILKTLKINKLDMILGQKCPFISIDIHVFNIVANLLKKANGQNN